MGDIIGYVGGKPRRRKTTSADNHRQKITGGKQRRRKTTSAENHVGGKPPAENNRRKTTLAENNLCRIGWTFISGHVLLCDNGDTVDLSLDPPVVVPDAVKRAVRCWSFSRIDECHPGLVPEHPDFLLARPPMKPVVTCTIRSTFWMCSEDTAPGRTKCPTFDHWQTRCKSDLISAVSGGHWPQARLASVKDWTDDNRCQLCLEAVGTLSHRLVCKLIKPKGDWQVPPAECQKIAWQLDPKRLETLSTRGLFALKLVLPKPPPGATFRWLLHPPEDIPDDAVFYIDGSLFDEAWRFARRTSFGIVITAASGALLGFGNGIPQTGSMMRLALRYGPTLWSRASPTHRPSSSLTALAF